MKPAEAYILAQEEPFREILLQLQTLIEQVVPGASLRYKYRIPFYYLDDKPFCYLNQSGTYVDLGLVHGNRLTRHTDLMVSQGRKWVRSLRYERLTAIDYNVLKNVLTEAMAVHSGPLSEK